MMDLEKAKVRPANPAYKTVKNMHMMEKAMDDRRTAVSSPRAASASSPSR